VLEELSSALVISRLYGIESVVKRLCEVDTQVSSSWVAPCPRRARW
jgi:hypothetical protein